MTSNVQTWIKKEENRRKTLMAIAQPLTGKQIGKRTGIPMDTCSYVVGKLVNKGLLTCLNPQARNSRLYWLTDLGRQCRGQLHQESGLECKVYSLQDIDWDLYGSICFSHRSIVMRMLTEPMQPSEIKRTIRKRRAGTKISANNIRDVIKLLLDKEIVQKVHTRKKAHPRYELTDSGIKLRELLMKAEMSYW